jgi:hypothetical protein
MPSPHVYDKAKYHYETVEGYGLAQEHAANHTVFFLRWLIENDLMNAWFVEESGDLLDRFRAGGASIHDVYGSWDCCLIDDMLSDDGNKFARHYFDFDRGKYLEDYTKTLQGDLESEFHIEFTEANYRRLKPTIDRRYEAWTTATKKR